MRSHDDRDRITEQQADTFDATQPLLKAMGNDLRKFALKKPDASLSKQKVAFVNRLLTDLRELLANEPSIKYLDLLTDEDLPQYSDVVLIISQYDAAMTAFSLRYTRLSYETKKREWQLIEEPEGEKERDEDEEAEGGEEWDEDEEADDDNTNTDDE
jgi:hypothetical protein